ncbi:hypothetical protein DFP72DRAFT_890451 [Ephemerocybe angulata]|uniref:Secreted protein n=1 Tax=Ephemerocybe angulata TaxID=980116 RepID=A0A8H6I4D7_9AGAR|nr:hypothetical protein DFP72DRAFT_890451 [Tulosesus angulatus]
MSTSTLQRGASCVWTHIAVATLFLRVGDSLCITAVQDPVPLHIHRVLAGCAVAGATTSRAPGNFRGSGVPPRPPGRNR